MATKLTIDKNTQQKKRGRPPKTEIKNKPMFYEETKENEELVLYLPLTEKNTDFKTECSINEETHNSTSFVEPSDSSDDNVEELFSSKPDIAEIDKLINEIKKRDVIIKNLKDNLKNSKPYQQENLISINKENKKILINLGLISFNDNKLITCSSSKIACWWCTHNFDTHPVFLPEKYHNSKYYVFGNFCSFGCALAYNDNSINDYRRQIRDSLLKKLYKDIFNKDCLIKPAGPKEILEKFGGPVSIETYRGSDNVCSKVHKISIPPMIPLLSHYEEITINS